MKIYDGMNGDYSYGLFVMLPEVDYVLITSLFCAQKSINMTISGKG